GRGEGWKRPARRPGTLSSRRWSGCWQQPKPAQPADLSDQWPGHPARVLRGCPGHRSERQNIDFASGLTTGYSITNPLTVLLLAPTILPPLTNLAWPSPKTK